MIYVSSSCIRENRIENVLEEFYKIGINNVELSGGTEYHNKIYENLEYFYMKRGMKYACHAYFPPAQNNIVLNLASCNDKIYKDTISHYERCIELLPKIGCRTLSVHAGFLVEIPQEQLGKTIKSKIIYDYEEAMQRFCKAYLYIVKLAKKEGIEVYLENNVLSAENYEGFNFRNYLLMTDVDSIGEMRKRIDFNLLLDLGHLHVSAKTLQLDYIEQCRRLANDVKWIHVSENNGIIDQHKGITESSEIVKSLSEIYRNDINITLETVADVDTIIESYEIVNKVIEEYGEN